ncbi:hypothetical protein [Microtetraspora malaysiensis]|uniref:hypothetical protein n=1 Tax=Microtetraspora malaysiensis TaxID=161358 RepID=UPI003D94E34A
MAEDVPGGIGVAGSHIDDGGPQLGQIWRRPIDQVNRGQAEVGPERGGHRVRLRDQGERVAHHMS